MKARITKIAGAIIAGGALIAGAIYIASQSKADLAKAATTGETSVLTVDTLVSKAKQYAGKNIALHGVVDRVSAEQRLVTLIDPSEANCTDACERNLVVVSVPDEFNLALAKPRGEVVVRGAIGDANSPLRMTASRIVFEPAEVKRALAGAAECCAAECETSRKEECERDAATCCKSAAPIPDGRQAR
jgi:hypothetical protein